MTWEKKAGNNLSPATATTLGGIKVGSGLNVTTDGTLSVSTTTTPLAEQVTGVYLIPNILNYTINSNNGVEIKPISGQKIYIYYLNKIVSYDLPTITIGNNYTLRVDVSTGTFRAVSDAYLFQNEILLLRNKIGTNGYDKGLIEGALSQYIVYPKSMDYLFITPKNYTALPITTSAIQSFTFVGSELWVFDKDINTSQLYRRDPTTFNLIGSAIHHSLGYWNSVDYNSDLDCIVAGNGTGTGQYTDNKAIIYYDISTWTTLTELTTSTVKYIDIDLNGLNATGNNDFKVQACWGDNNFGENNIIYIVTNDGRNIRKLMLGKGTNNLGSGTFNTVAITDFNGTYKILNEWSQTDGGGHVQDIYYYNGAIYNNSKDSITESGLIIWKHELCLNGVINKRKIFIPVYDNTTGNLATVDTGEAITINNNKIYASLLGSYYFTIDVPI